MSDGLLDEQFGVEMAALEQERFSLEMSGIQLWVVLANLQLALRHPGNRGPSAAIARGVAESLEGVVTRYAAMARVAAMGWDEAYDEPWGEEVGDG